MASLRRLHVRRLSLLPVSVYLARVHQQVIVVLVKLVGRADRFIADLS